MMSGSPPPDQFRMRTVLVGPKFSVPAKSVVAAREVLRCTSTPPFWIVRNPVTVRDLPVFPDAGPLTSVAPVRTVTLRTVRLVSPLMVNPEQITTESAAPGTVLDAAPPQTVLDQLAATAKSPVALE